MKYCKLARENLFSITQELSKGAKLESNDINNIILTCPAGSKITFNWCIKTTDGCICEVNVTPISNEKANVDTQRTVNVNKYHRELGHPCEATTRATVKYFDIKLVGKFKPCESCALGKAKQKNVSKLPAKQEKYPGERLCLNISLPTTKVLEVNIITYLW